MANRAEPRGKRDLSRKLKKWSSRVKNVNLQRYRKIIEKRMDKGVDLYLSIS